MCFVGDDSQGQGQAMKHTEVLDITLFTSWATSCIAYICVYKLAYNILPIDVTKANSVAILVQPALTMVMFSLRPVFF